MSEAGIDAEIAVLQYKQRNKAKKVIQDQEFSELPKLIHVTYNGDENQFMHNGRSKLAKKNPFRFQKGKDKYIAMNQPEDIKYFLSQQAEYFKVEVMDSTKLIAKKAKTAKATVKSLEAELNALKKIEAEKKARAKTTVKDIKALKAKAKKGDK